MTVPELPASEAVETFEVPTETIYVSNLNENIKIKGLPCSGFPQVASSRALPKVIKQTLRNLFRNFGPVLDVVAHRNVRMRGQAFVAMDSSEHAAKAVKDVQRFPLYGKPMQLAFAKTRADAVVKRKAPTEFDYHKQERVQRKSGLYPCLPFLADSCCRGDTVHESTGVEAKGAESSKERFVSAPLCDGGHADKAPQPLQKLNRETKPPLQQLRPPPQSHAKPSKCRTSTCRRTRSSSSSSCPRQQARSRSRRSSSSLCFSRRRSLSADGALPQIPEPVRGSDDPRASHHRLRRVHRRGLVVHCTGRIAQQRLRRAEDQGHVCEAVVVHGCIIKVPGCVLKMPWPDCTSLPSCRGKWPKIPVQGGQLGSATLIDLRTCS
jgi:RNA recognition motif-containing protein